MIDIITIATITASIAISAGHPIDATSLLPHDIIIPAKIVQ